MITALLAASPQPHTDVQASSWTATNIAEFFRAEASVEVAVGAINRAKLSSEQLFDGSLDGAMLSQQLGITLEAEQEQIHRALDELGARLTVTPGSAWDWRLANRRLCDWWIMPLASYAPEVLLIWSRYHNPSGALGILDDELDQAGPLWFWTTFMLVPSYPLYRLGSSHPIRGLAGTVIHFTLFVRVVCEVCLTRCMLHERGLGASACASPTVHESGYLARPAGARPLVLCQGCGQTSEDGALGIGRHPARLLRLLLDAPRYAP